MQRSGNKYQQPNDHATISDGDLRSSKMLSASQDIVGVEVRHHLRRRRDGRDCGRIYEMKVAGM
jgi:hypothetical protein